jgi:hypothetical protein
MTVISDGYSDQPQSTKKFDRVKKSFSDRFTCLTLVVGQFLNVHVVIDVRA